MSEPRFDVVHVGSASRDLTDEDPRGWRLGGGASYSALTTARLGLRTTAMIGVDPAAAAASEFDLLRAAGVDLHLVPLDEGPVFRNLETPFGRVQAWPSHGRPLPVVRLRRAWREARAWSLVPVASELDEAWASVVPDTAVVCVGWQGLLREQGPDLLARRRAPGRSALLDIADLVGASRDDLSPDWPLREVTRLLPTGCRLALTDGYHGGRLLTVTRDRHTDEGSWSAVLPAQVVDPTGAGDVFLAALLASIVRPELTSPTGDRRPAPDLEFAAAAASYVVEAPGVLGVPELRAVLARLGRA